VTRDEPPFPLLGQENRETKRLAVSKSFSKRWPMGLCARSRSLPKGLRSSGRAAWLAAALFLGKGAPWRQAHRPWERREPRCKEEFCKLKRHGSRALVKPQDSRKTTHAEAPSPRHRLSSRILRRNFPNRVRGLLLALASLRDLPKAYKAWMALQPGWARESFWR